MLFIKMHPTFKERKKKTAEMFLNITKYHEGNWMMGMDPQNQ
jgi:hypothetical protein